MTTVRLARLSYPAGGETGRNRGLSRPTEIDGFAVRDPTNVEIIPTWPELMKIFDSVMNFLDFLPTSALCRVSGGWV